MLNKSWIWKVIIAIVIVGVLVAVGFWLYQLGYRNGVAAASDAEGLSRRISKPSPFFWDQDEADGHVPTHHRSDFPFSERLFLQDHFPVKTTYLSPYWFVLKLVVFGVFLWLVYKVISLLTRGKGWQLSFHSIEESDEKGKKK